MNEEKTLVEIASRLSSALMLTKTINPSQSVKYIELALEEAERQIDILRIKEKYDI